MKKINEGRFWAGQVSLLFVCCLVGCHCLVMCFITLSFGTWVVQDCSQLLHQVLGIYSPSREKGVYTYIHVRKNSSLSNLAQPASRSLTGKIDNYYNSACMATISNCGQLFLPTPSVHCSWWYATTFKRYIYIYIMKEIFWCVRILHFSIQPESVAKSATSGPQAGNQSCAVLCRLSYEVRCRTPKTLHFSQLIPAGF